MKNARFLLLLFTLMFLVSCREATKETALMLYEQALEASAHDSIRQSEQLLHRAIRTAKAEGDHHTLYLSQLQLAQSLSWGNADAALDMARQALDTYKQHPDKARNHIIILDRIAELGKENDIDLKFVLPEGSNWSVDMMCVPTNCQNYEGAMAFINFMYDPEIALENCEYVGYSTPNVATKAMLDPEIANNIYYYPTAEVFVTLEVYYTSSDIEEKYTQIWNTVKASA